MPSNGRDRFTIGWISPLPLEAEAARAALDDYYGRVDGEDGCYYITGRMGQHDVVVGIQTQIGAAQAASLAQRMATSFRNIELFLVVGIAGGVPHYESGGEREEMVLGDVVICVPGGGHSGVYAYDQGAWKNEGELVQRGVTNKPAPRLLDAVNLLRTGFDRTRISEALTSIRNKIEPDDRSKFQDHSSDGERDRIFHSNYAHLNEMQSCKECKCDLKHSSSRSARGEKAVRAMDRPKVHYGCIGSANQLQMSAKKRDELRDSWMRVIAFEMEYVGVIDNHPCITIRGISDYADGHKDKSWQAYAAATAAACAKIVLEAVPPSRRASEGWTATHSTHNQVTFEMKQNHTNSLKQQPVYVVERPSLLDMINDKIGKDIKHLASLNLHGMTGCGKTVIARLFAQQRAFSACFELPGKSKLEFQAALAKSAEDIPGLSSEHLVHANAESEDPTNLQIQEERNVITMMDWFNANGNTHWFVLIDDVQSQDFERSAGHWLQQFIARLDQGTVITTSQTSMFTQTHRNVKVEGLLLTESLHLMEDILGVSGTDQESSDRKQLAALLENHALSVESAALYCRHTKKHVKQYIQLWNNSDPKIFETSEMVPTLTKTVALAVENLTSQARGLLLQCAFLDSGCIWPELFPGMSLEIYESLVTELGAISLLEIASTQEAGDNSIAVHPAVHKIVRLIAIERDDVGDCIAIVINNIAQAIPSAHDENVSDKQRLILPHVAQCRSNLQLFTEYEDLYINPVILPALGRLGWMLYQRGQLQDAEAFYSMALETYDVIFTADVTAPNTEVLADLGGSQTLPVISSMIYKDADYYDIVNSYGLLYKARGEVENAKRCFEMVRKSSDEASPLGDDLSRPALDVNLALSMRQGGRLHEARELLERARKAYEDADDEQSRYQLCKVHQYLGSVYKMEGEYWKAAEAIRRNVCAELSSIDVDPTSLPLAIANKELGSIYLLEDGKGSLVKAAKCFDDARVGIEKHCMKDSSIAIDLRWHQLMLRMAKARRMQADRDIFIQETCEAFNVFIKDLTRWRRNEPVTLHAIRTYGKSLMKLGRWEEGGDYLMRAIAGYKKRKDHPLDAAFAKKDLADGYLRQFDLSEHALNPGHLDEAKRYYLEAMNLFATICSPYAESFMSTIVERIEAIEKRTNQSIQLQQRFPALPPTSNLGRMETQMTPPTSPVHSLQNVNNIRTDANIGSTHAQSQGELRFAWIWKWIG